MRRIAGLTVIPDAMIFCSTDLDGTNVDSSEFRINTRVRYSSALDSIVAQIKRTLDRGDQLVCVGGIIAAEMDDEGKITKPDRRLTDWIGQNFAADLNEELGAPVRIRSAMPQISASTYRQNPDYALTIARELLEELGM